MAEMLVHSVFVFFVLCDVAHSGTDVGGMNCFGLN
jgi:hypothetical protein